MKHALARIVRAVVVVCLASASAVHAQDLPRVTAGVRRAVVSPPLRPVPSGDVHADVTIVEYFDYNCSVCRRMEPTLRSLLHGDRHIRLIYKDWPVFGAVSVYAAYCAFAAADLGQYETAHRALMSAAEPLDSQLAVETELRRAGLDVAALRADIAAHRAQFSAVLTRNQGEASALGLRGTPGLVIGDQLINGGLDMESLRLLVARARLQSSDGS